MERFWMVWVENSSFPRMRHETMSDAIKEAERLCDKESKPVYVLEAGMVCKPIKKHEWESIEDAD